MPVPSDFPRYKAGDSITIEGRWPPLIGSVVEGPHVLTESEAVLCNMAWNEAIASTQEPAADDRSMH
ncbi:MAG: hypothetical protein ACRDKI_06910 [Solirubrobacterales bacterium]